MAVVIVQQSNWHVAQITNQLRAQQQAATLQANLGQALFETERYAKRLVATAPKDLFAASILAHDWLQQIQGIGPEAFTDVANKRAWADALSTIRAIEQRGRMEPETALAVNQYLRCREQWKAHRAKFVDSPAEFLDRARDDLNRAVARRDAASRKVRSLGIASAIAAVVSIAVAIAGSSAGFLLPVAGGAFAFLAFRERSDAEEEVTHRERGVKIAEGNAIEYNAFFADPNGGLFLERMAKEHRLLFEEPIPEPTDVAAVSAPGAVNTIQTYVERRIVERQVVVTRCKFCNDMTPVDAKTCQHCGAPAFST